MGKHSGHKFNPGKNTLISNDDTFIGKMKLRIYK